MVESTPGNKQCLNPVPANHGRAVAGDDSLWKPCAVTNCGDCLADYQVCVACVATHKLVETTPGTKQCLNPLPAKHGRAVAGDDSLWKPCATSNCDDCLLDYQVCTTCESTHKLVETTPGTKQCLNPLPASHGRAVAGDDSLWKPCSLANCGDCLADYQVCVACATPHKFVESTPGNKQCLNPVPANHGRAVAGDDSLWKPCTLANCADCLADYQVCVTCAATYKFVESTPGNKQCLNPVPANHGRAVAGDDSLWKPCSASNCGDCLADHQVCVTCVVNHKFVEDSSGNKNCLNPVPASHGRAVAGDDTLWKTCSSPNCADCLGFYLDCTTCSNPTVNVQIPNPDSSGNKICQTQVKYDFTLAALTNGNTQLGTDLSTYSYWYEIVIKDSGGATISDSSLVTTQLVTDIKSGLKVQITEKDGTAIAAASRADENMNVLKKTHTPVDRLYVGFNITSDSPGAKYKAELSFTTISKPGATIYQLTEFTSNKITTPTFTSVLPEETNRNNESNQNNESNENSEQNENNETNQTSQTNQTNEILPEDAAPEYTPSIHRSTFGSSQVSEIISMAAMLSSVDGGGVTATFGQTLKFVFRLKYINVDWGDYVTSFFGEKFSRRNQKRLQGALDRRARILSPQEQKDNNNRILEKADNDEVVLNSNGFKGQLSKHNVAVIFTMIIYAKSVIYVLTWVTKIAIGIILECMRREKITESAFIFKVARLNQKIHFTVFMFVVTDLSFHCSRTLLHTRPLDFSPKVLTSKILAMISFSLIFVDLAIIWLHSYSIKPDEMRSTYQRILQEKFIKSDTQRFENINKKVEKTKKPPIDIEKSVKKLGKEEDIKMFIRRELTNELDVYKPVAVRFLAFLYLTKIVTNQILFAASQYQQILMLSLMLILELSQFGLNLYYYFKVKHLKSFLIFLWKVVQSFCFVLVFLSGILIYILYGDKEEKPKNLQVVVVFSTIAAVGIEYVLLVLRTYYMIKDYINLRKVKKKLKKRGKLYKGMFARVIVYLEKDKKTKKNGKNKISEPQSKSFLPETGNRLLEKIKKSKKISRRAKRGVINRDDWEEYDIFNGGSESGCLNSNREESLVQKKSSGFFGIGSVTKKRNKKVFAKKMRGSIRISKNEALSMKSFRKNNNAKQKKSSFKSKFQSIRNSNGQNENLPKSSLAQGLRMARSNKIQLNADHGSPRDSLKIQLTKGKFRSGSQSPSSRESGGSIRSHLGVTPTPSNNRIMSTRIKINSARSPERRSMRHTNPAARGNLNLAQLAIMKSIVQTHERGAPSDLISSHQDQNFETLQTDFEEDHMKDVKMNLKLERKAKSQRSGSLWINLKSPKTGRTKLQPRRRGRLRLKDFSASASKLGGSRSSLSLDKKASKFNMRRGGSIRLKMNKSSPENPTAPGTGPSGLSRFAFKSQLQPLNLNSKKPGKSVSSESSDHSRSNSYERSEM